MSSKGRNGSLRMLASSDDTAEPEAGVINSSKG